MTWVASRYRALPAWTQVVLPYAALTIVSAAAFYLRLFARLQTTSDDRYVLLSLRDFVDGGDLYSTVFSQVGPLYYETFGALFKIAGKSVTYDSAGVISVVLMTASGLGFGALTEAITKDRRLGVLAQLIVVTLLLGGSPAPLEPLVLESLFVLALSAGLLWRPNSLVAGVALGALLATHFAAGSSIAVAIAVAIGTGALKSGRRSATTIVVAAFVVWLAALVIAVAAGAGDIGKALGSLHFGALIVLLLIAAVPAGARGAARWLHGHGTRLLADRAALAALGAALVALAIAGILRPLERDARAYHQGRALKIAGFGRIHVNGEEAAGYEQLAAATAACDPLAVVGRFYTADLFTGRQAATPGTVQRPGLCVLVDRRSDVGAAGPTRDLHPYLRRTPMVRVLALRVRHEPARLELWIRPGAGATGRARPVLEGR